MGSWPWKGGQRDTHDPFRATLAKKSQRTQRGQGPTQGHTAPQHPLKENPSLELPGLDPRQGLWGRVLQSQLKLAHVSGPCGLGLATHARHMHLCPCVPTCRPVTSAPWVCVCVGGRGTSLCREKSSVYAIVYIGFCVYKNILVCRTPAAPTSPRMASSPECPCWAALFALVHVVTSEIAEDEDDPEEGHSTQHLHGDAQLARAQLPGDPRERSPRT